MAREIFIVQNVSTNKLEIADFGIKLNPGQTIDLGNFDDVYLSDEVEQHILSNDLVRLIDGSIASDEDLYKSTVVNQVGPVSFADFYIPADQPLSGTIGTYTDIQWNTTREIEDDYALDAAGYEVEFTKDGKYIVFLRVGIKQTANNGRSDEIHDLQIDTGGGFSTIPGTTGHIYSRQTTNGFGDSTIACVLDVSAGTKIKARGALNVGNGQLSFEANACSLTISNIKGQPGTSGLNGKDGTNGADSSINILVNNVLQSSGNASFINFSGYNIDSSVTGEITNIDFAFQNLNTLGLRRTTDFSVTTGWTDVQYDTVDVSSGGAISWNNTNPERITFNEDGVYCVSYISTVTNTTTNTNTYTQFVLNGGTQVPGSYQQINNYQGDTHSLFSFFLVNANEGDYVNPQSYRDQTSSTLLADTVTTVFRLEGVKGDSGADGTDGIDGIDGKDGSIGPQGPAGPSGAGSSVVVSKDGTGLFTVTELNFQNDIQLSQDGSVADISVTLPIIPDVSIQLQSEGSDLGDISTINFSGKYVNTQNNSNIGDISIDIPEVSIGIIDNGTDVGKFKQIDFTGNIVSSSEQSPNDIAEVAINQIYGSEFHLVQDLASSTSTSTAPVIKGELVTTSLPSGNYKLMVGWVWRHSSANNDAIFDVTQNGTALGTRSEINIESKDVNTYRPEYRVFYLNLSGIQTFNFRYWNEGGNTTVSDVTLELIRVS